VLTVAVVAANVAVLEPPGTATEAGTVSAALDLEIATDAPLAGAAAFSFTVQVLDAFDPMLVTAHVSVDGVVTPTGIPPRAAWAVNKMPAASK
jgi:hypothetical protein